MDLLRSVLQGFAIVVGVAICLPFWCIGWVAANAVEALRGGWRDGLNAPMEW